MIAGVEFSFPHNIVDSGILEPLRIAIEETGVIVSADVLEYLSYGLQMHLTNVIEACIKNSSKRRNVVGIKMYTNLHDKIHIKQEKPDAKTALGIAWGPHVSSLLANEEKLAREELKQREQEEEAAIVKEMRQFDEEKRASMANGSKRGRTAQADIVESPWWVKEVSSTRIHRMDRIDVLLYIITVYSQLFYNILFCFLFCFLFCSQFFFVFIVGCGGKGGSVRLAQSRTSPVPTGGREGALSGGRGGR